MFKFYDVDKIIRVGSTGAYVEDLKLYDTVLVDSAYADSNAFRKLVLNDHSFVAYPSASLNEEIKKSAEKLGIEMKTARTHSSDVFYSSVPLSERIAESQVCLCGNGKLCAIYKCWKIRKASLLAY